MSGSNTFIGHCVIQYTVNISVVDFPSIVCSLLLNFLSSIRFTVFSLYLYLEVDDSPHSSLAVT